MNKLKESFGTRIMTIILSWIIALGGMAADYYQIYSNNHFLGKLLLVLFPLGALFYSIFRALDYINYYGKIKIKKRQDNQMILDMEKDLKERQKESGLINAG
jgi:predicted membrane protein